jgi:hypothetical protein
MKTLYKKSVSARELPPEWQKEGEFAPDEQVSVWIEPTDAELAATVSLGELMDVIGRRAQARGLTDETLETILYDAP